MSWSHLCPLFVSVLVTYGLALDYDAKIRVEVNSLYVRVHLKAPTSFKTNKVFLQINHFQYKHSCPYARKIIFPSSPQDRYVFISGENLTAEFPSPGCQGKFLLSATPSSKPFLFHGKVYQPCYYFQDIYAIWTSDCPSDYESFDLKAKAESPFCWSLPKEKMCSTGSSKATIPFIPPKTSGNQVFKRRPFTKISPFTSPFTSRPPIRAPELTRESDENRNFTGKIILGISAALLLILMIGGIVFVWRTVLDRTMQNFDPLSSGTSYDEDSNQLSLRTV